MYRKIFTYAIMMMALLALIVSAGCDSPKKAAASSETGRQAHDEHDHGENHLETEKHQDDPHGHTESEHEEDGHDDHDDHANHDDRADGDDHEGHAESGTDSHDDGEAGHVDVVQLSNAELVEFGIELATAGPGELISYVTLPGEIVINTDTMAHIVPRVGGIVRKVHKKLGDEVAAGEIIAELESRELAEIKVNYLSARERFSLANEIFLREEKLWKKQISAEQDFLSTRQSLSEARIELRSAEQKLHALGFSENYLAKELNRPDVNFTRYQVTAPFAGTVIEKHLTLGETVKEDSEVFIIADLTTVWADIKIYQKDLPLIKKGLSVRIDPGHGLPVGQGVISYVGPIIGESTRTAPARIELDNSAETWRPGMFITARIAAGNEHVGLLVPKSALQTFEGSQVVFVQDEDGFEPKPIVLGRTNSDQVEVVSGLHVGDRYVSKGAFTLKAQLSKGAFGDGHNH